MAQELANKTLSNPLLFQSVSDSMPEAVKGFCWVRYPQFFSQRECIEPSPTTAREIIGLVECQFWE